ncbi:MAG: creatininase family protein [Clostridiales bacterium]|nr:creatininase family protein [Clostridiales bacterium]
MKEHLIANMTWPEAEQSIKEARAVILPLGSTEQHGYHMAVGTDTVVSDYVCLELAARTNCVVLPTLPYGQVWSAKGFPATISLHQSTFIQIVKDIVVSLEQQGARNIILFSGHYGNMQPSRDAARELMDEYGYRNVWYLGYMNVEKYNAALMQTQLWNKKTFHAAELETSIMLHISPEKVRMEKAVREEPEVPAGLDLRPIHWKEFSQSGLFGNAALATEEKGKQYLEWWLNDLTQIVTQNIG